MEINLTDRVAIGNIKMKKIILALILGVFCMANAKTAVVYFSATGTTKQMAEKAAKAIGAELFEIVPAQAYTSADLDWHDKKSRSTIESNDPKSRPAIKNKIDVKDYDTVILAYPIWWGYAPKIMYTFVESQSFEKKNLITLCTSGGSGLGPSGKDIAKAAKGSVFKGGKEFNYGSEADIKKFVEGALK